MLSLVLLAAPAAAQMRASELVGPVDPALWGVIAPAARPAPISALDGGDPRWPGSPPRTGLIAAFPLGDNARLGVGRFSVAQIARPRTHMESERHPMAVRPRERGIAAVGISLSF